MTTSHLYNLLQNLNESIWNLQESHRELLLQTQEIVDVLEQSLPLCPVDLVSQDVL